MTNAELQFMATVSSQMRVIAKQLEKLNENFEALINNIKPTKMSKQIDLSAFYNDCVDFWKRMGVKRDDNLIALGLLDIKCSFPESVCEDYLIQSGWYDYFSEVADKALAEIKKERYNEHRGKNGFLSESGL